MADSELIDTKPETGMVVDTKPQVQLLVDIKPIIGQILRPTEDDVLVRFYAGMSLGPGFLMFVTIPTTGTMYP